MFKASREVIIRTPGFREALQFYQDVLGFRIASRHGGIVGFETGELCLYVEEGPPHGPVLEFLVADVAAARARLLAAGCTLIEEDAALPRCYLRDPFGVTFNIGPAKA